MDVEKEMICTELLNLDRKAKIAILAIIKKYDENKILRFSDGCRVDLNTLPESVLTTIYTKINIFLN